MLCIFNLVLLTSIFAGQVSSTNQPGCLTWEVHAGYLNLTCRLENFVQPVTLIDNHEKAHISCTLKKAKHNIGCIPKKRRKHISFDSSLQTVTFTIKNKYSNYVDGMWKCQQGCNSYETEVSTTKGIIDSTDISLYGELMDDDTERKVKLKCVSCRAPRRNHAEFLINGSSDTSIVYNKINGKCIHNNVDCEPHICSCSSNEFIHTFPVTSSYSTDYTCDMIFNDNDKGSKFSKNATLYFNGKDFLDKDYKTAQAKGPKETADQKTGIIHDRPPKTDYSKIQFWAYETAPVVIGGVVQCVIVMVLLICCIKGRGDNEENTLQLEELFFKTGGKDKLYSTSDKCEPCGTKGIKSLSMYLCLRCDEHLCKGCKANHSAMKHFRCHSILEIASVPEMFRWYKQCRHHEKDIEYFCENHKRLCCKKCILTMHRHCTNIKTIEEVSEGFRKSSEFDVYKEHLESVAYACELLEKFIYNNKNKIESDKTRILELIDRNRLNGEDQSHQGNEKTSFSHQLETQLNNTVRESLNTLDKQNEVILANKTSTFRIKKDFNFMSMTESVHEIELFLLVLMSKDSLTKIESNLSNIIRESKTIRLTFASDITTSCPYIQTIVLHMAPPERLRFLLSPKINRPV